MEESRNLTARSATPSGGSVQNFCPKNNNERIDFFLKSIEELHAPLEGVSSGSWEIFKQFDY